MVGEAHILHAAAGIRRGLGVPVVGILQAEVAGQVLLTELDTRIPPVSVFVMQPRLLPTPRMQLLTFTSKPKTADERSQPNGLR